jgi:hypothetical protein
MSGQVFYQTKLTRDPIGNERGRLTLHYIIAVQTHDPDGNPYEGHPEDRAREPDDWREYAAHWLPEHGLPANRVMLVAGPSPLNPNASHRLELMRLGAST